LFTFSTDNSQALFPVPFNVALGAIVNVNATCGETGPEYYCRAGEQNLCSICDAFSADHSKRHPIDSIVDGKSDTWWQGPTLQSGSRFEWITITLNLRQMYEIRRVTLVPAVSSLPANWALERSIDGVHFSAWQYFAASDTECSVRFRVRPTIGKMRVRSDDEVICTSYHTKQASGPNDDLVTSLVEGRPGFEETSGDNGDLSWTLREFVKAQYIRIRMQKFKPINGVNNYENDKNDKSLARRVS